MVEGFGERGATCSDSPVAWVVCEEALESAESWCSSGMPSGPGDAGCSNHTRFSLQHLPLSSEYGTYETVKTRCRLPTREMRQNGVPVINLS